MGLSATDIARLSPAAQRQIVDKLSCAAGHKAQNGGIKKPSKYGNRKTPRTMPNGTVRLFDSQKEAQRYDELCLLLSRGLISDLRLQPQFTITESYITAEGERIRAERYTADFIYTDTKSGKRIVEDAKGYRTGRYIDRRKAVMDKYGVIIQEV